MLARLGTHHRRGSLTILKQIKLPVRAVSASSQNLSARDPRVIRDDSKADKYLSFGRLLNEIKSPSESAFDFTRNSPACPFEGKSSTSAENLLCLSIPLTYHARTLEDFENLVLDAPLGEMVLVYYYATWCDLSQEATPIIDQFMCQDNQHIRLVKITPDTCSPKLAMAISEKTITGTMPMLFSVMNGDKKHQNHKTISEKYLKKILARTMEKCNHPIDKSWWHEETDVEAARDHFADGGKLEFHSKQFRSKKPATAKPHPLPI